MVGNYLNQLNILLENTLLLREHKMMGYKNRTTNHDRQEFQDAPKIILQVISRLKTSNQLVSFNRTQHWCIGSTMTDILVLDWK